jgi:hypothetical protein
MPKFPSKEVDISTLAYTMILGYIAHHDDFPNVQPFDLLNAFKRYKIASDAQIQAKSIVRLATERKNAKLNSLYQTMKGCLKKSAVDVTDDGEKLAYIGWGPRADPQPVGPPAAPGNLVSLAEGPGSVILRWDSPVGGGPVRNYIVEWREQTGGGPFGAWNIVGTALNNEINLTDQPRGPQLEYRIKAINIGGESLPSNTAAVVL